MGTPDLDQTMPDSQDKSTCRDVEASLKLPCIIFNTPVPSNIPKEELRCKGITMTRDRTTSKISPWLTASRPLLDLKCKDSKVKHRAPVPQTLNSDPQACTLFPPLNPQGSQGSV